MVRFGGVVIYSVQMMNLIGVDRVGEALRESTLTKYKRRTPPHRAQVRVRGSQVGFRIGKGSFWGS